MSGERRCDNCSYYKKNPTQLNQGHCHRFPPTAFAIQTGNTVQFISSFPAVKADCIGCYEFASLHEMLPLPDKDDF